MAKETMRATIERLESASKKSAKAARKSDNRFNCMKGTLSKLQKHLAILETSETEARGRYVDLLEKNNTLEENEKGMKQTFVDHHLEIHQLTKDLNRANSVVDNLLIQANNHE